MILTPFKQFFEKAFAKEAASFRKNPALLVDWIRKNIRMNPNTRAMRTPTRPKKCVGEPYH